jgi:hypothetical protein
MTKSIRQVSVLLKWCHYLQHNDIPHNGTQHNTLGTAWQKALDRVVLSKWCHYLQHNVIPQNGTQHNTLGSSWQKALDREILPKWCHYFQHNDIPQNDSQHTPLGSFMAIMAIHELQKEYEVLQIRTQASGLNELA